MNPHLKEQTVTTDALWSPILHYHQTLRQGCVVLSQNLSSIYCAFLPLDPSTIVAAASPSPVLPPISTVDRLLIILLLDIIRPWKQSNRSSINEAKASNILGIFVWKMSSLLCMYIQGILDMIPPKDGGIPVHAPAWGSA